MGGVTNLDVTDRLYSFRCVVYILYHELIRISDKKLISKMVEMLNEHPKN